MGRICLRGERAGKSFVLIRFTTPFPSSTVSMGQKTIKEAFRSNLWLKKSVTINAVSDSQCCHAKLFQTYISLVPPCVIEQNQKFYLQPTVSPKPGKYWYHPKPLDVNRLKGLVSQMFSKAEINGTFTNHSLRATGVSTLFSTGVPEALIKKRSGHRSTEALRLYETHGVDTK